MIGLTPVVLRASTQGLLGPALTASGLTVATLFLAPARWRGAAGVAAATVAGLALLTPSLGLAMGTFVAAGILLTARRAEYAFPGRSARVVIGAGLSVGATVLLASALVSVPTAVVSVAILAAFAAEKLRPAWLERLVGAAADRLERFPVADTVRRPAARLAAIRAAVNPASGRWVLLVCAVAAAVGVLLGVRDQRFVLIDDAAITFRYAARIASGDGFTYNDGDRTNGASAPLYTLLLALGHLLGRDIETVARSVGVVSYAATAAFVTAIAGRARGFLAAGGAAFVLLTSAAFRTEALTGMESGFAAMLGVLVILLVIEGRLTWAGVVLGLAVVNKVDAGFLALAVGAAWLLVHRRPPWRLAAVAAVTAAPWFLFSLVYFGSVLPFSATQKIGGEVANPNAAHDPLWIFRRVESDRLDLLLIVGLLFAALVVVRLVRVDKRASLAVLSCGLWMVLHGGAFSLIDLGDPYPWYTTVVFPPLIAGGVISLVILAEKLAGVVPAGRLAGMSRHGLGRVLAATLLFLVMTNLAPGFKTAEQVVRDGHLVTDFELFEDTRRQAGRYTGEHAEPGEVVQSCYGWVAFGALDNPFRETCPLSTQIDPGPPTWIVNTYLRDQTGDRLPAQSELVRVFSSPMGDSFVYRLGYEADDQQIICGAAEAFVELQDMSTAGSADLQERFTTARDSAAALAELDLSTLDRAANEVLAEFERAVAAGDSVDWAPDDPVTQELIALTTGDGADEEFIQSVVELIEAAATRC